jgi:hypothetical protein
VVGKVTRHSGLVHRKGMLAPGCFLYALPPLWSAVTSCACWWVGHYQARRWCWGPYRCFESHCSGSHFVFLFPPFLLSALPWKLTAGPVLSGEALVLGDRAWLQELLQALEGQGLGAVAANAASHAEAKPTVFAQVIVVVMMMMMVVVVVVMQLRRCWGNTALYAAPSLWVGVIIGDQSEGYCPVERPRVG